MSRASSAFVGFLAIAAAAAVGQTGQAIAQDDISTLRRQREGQVRFGRWLVFSSANHRSGMVAEISPEPPRRDRNGDLKFECTPDTVTLSIFLPAPADDILITLVVDRVSLANFPLKNRSSWHLITEGSAARAVFAALERKQELMIGFFDGRADIRYAIDGSGEALGRFRARCRW